MISAPGNDEFVYITEISTPNCIDNNERTEQFTEQLRYYVYIRLGY